MTRLATSDARNAFADLLNRVSYRRERIVLHRRGKDVAAIVPLEDLELLHELEDRIDLEAVRRALQEEGSISAEDLRAELGL